MSAPGCSDVGRDEQVCFCVPASGDATGQPALLTPHQRPCQPSRGDQ